MTSQSSWSGVAVHVFEEFERSVCEPWLRHVAEVALAFGLESRSFLPEKTLAAARQAATSARSPLGVVLADDETLRELNKRHRGLDESTDVLSFSFGDHEEYHEDDRGSARSPEDSGFVLPPDEGAGLGEVIISYPRAERQAAESGHATARELALLIVHGVLHLLGHDHAELKQEEAMRASEAAVLDRVWENE